MFTVAFSTIVGQMLNSGQSVDAVEDIGYFPAMRPLYKANDFSLAATFKVSLSVERRIQFLCRLAFPEESNTLF